MRLIWALKFSDATDPTTGNPISRDLDFYASVRYSPTRIHSLISRTLIGLRRDAPSIQMQDRTAQRGAS
jgi:hypothetical protein